MIKDIQILMKVKSSDRVIIRHYINGCIIANDTVGNLLDRSKYKLGYNVYKIGVECDCLYLEVCE